MTTSHKVMGIDSSTLGVAWTVAKATPSGKISILASNKIDLTKKKEISDKLQVLLVEFQLVLLHQKPDHIFLEKPIFVKSPATMGALSIIVGAIMSVAISNGFKITLVPPSVWKPFIGHTNLNRTFQMQARKKLGRLESEKLFKRLRKSQTQRVLKYNFPKFDETDNDIADSCAIALYGMNLTCCRVVLQKSKDIALDQQELKRLGLVL